MHLGEGKLAHNLPGCLPEYSATCLLLWVSSCVCCAGGLGLTAILAAQVEPFRSWGAHLASFGGQVRRVVGQLEHSGKAACWWQ